MRNSSQAIELELRGLTVNGLRTLFQRFFLVVILLVIELCGDAYAQNSPIKIINLKNNDRVGREVIVKGTANIAEGDHLWILVRREDFDPLWWPQREVIVDPKTHAWHATAHFGGAYDIGWNFDIGIITVDSNGNNELKEYWMNAMQIGDWKPIQIPETTLLPVLVKVKKVRD